MSFPFIIVTIPFNYATRYKRDMKPMHDQFVEPLKKYANIIIDGNLKQSLVYNNAVKHLKESHILSEDIER